MRWSWELVSLSGFNVKASELRGYAQQWLGVQQGVYQDRAREFPDAAKASGKPVGSVRPDVLSLALFPFISMSDPHMVSERHVAYAPDKARGACKGQRARYSYWMCAGALRWQVERWVNPGAGSLL
jgi:hypothetical protein